MKFGEVVFDNKKKLISPQLQSSVQDRRKSEQIPYSYQSTLAKDTGIQRPRSMSTGNERVKVKPVVNVPQCIGEHTEHNEVPIAISKTQYMIRSSASRTTSMNSQTQREIAESISLSFNLNDNVSSDYFVPPNHLLENDTDSSSLENNFKESPEEQFYSTPRKISDM
eukprot:Awhi_evm2s13296